MFDSRLDTEHVFGHRPDMVRARVRRRRSIALTLVLLLVVAIPTLSKAVAQDDRPPAAYVVRAGDTLWSIAVRTSPGQDPRLVVDAIARANGITPGTLTPGQQLRLPACC
jgi:LysM repeat protein